MPPAPSPRRIAGMFNTIIVGVDGRAGGEDALALARALSGEGTQLVPVTADGGSPAAALHTAAAEHAADLIAIGSAHHGPVGRLLLGDAGRGVLHDAPCAVAVAPRDYREAAEPVRRIVVGFDASPEAEAALALAAQLTAARGGSVTCCTAWDIPTTASAGMYYMTELDSVMADVEREARQRQADARFAYPGVAGDVRRGRPRAVLEEASQGADLLVVGSRGAGALRRVALGSTSDHLVHHAQCPVLVVPRPAVAATEASTAA